MKLATFVLNGEERVGTLDGDRLALFPAGMGDMVDLIAKGGPFLDQFDTDGLETVDATSVRILPPIRRFRRDVLCTGWNYWDHFEEGIGKRGGQEVERPAAPTFFTKAPNALVGAHDPIAFDDRLSAKWDYEGEIAIIIGQEGRSIPRGKAREHIFGYCLANDVSQRDLQRRHGGQWLRGKSADDSTPLGPYIVTPDEVAWEDIVLECSVNGELRQRASTKQMAFPIETLIAELSFGMTLFPGDVLLTGTPSGIGMARTPPIFLKDGDLVDVRADGLGHLSNRVTRQDLAGASDVSVLP